MILAASVSGCSSYWKIKPSPTVAPIEPAETASAPQPASISQPANVATAQSAASKVPCDKLLRATPGLEEVRMDKSGLIETRQWTLTARDSAPRWAVVGAKDQPPYGWGPKPGIGKLKFDPPLQQALANGNSQYLAYAPSDVRAPGDAQTIATLNEVFGGAQGKFEWHGRTYSYALSKELACYAPLP
jgi:hypothetical protein